MQQPEIPAPQAPEAASAQDAPGVLAALARLPDKALLTEDALARALDVSKRTVRRMVARFELPPAVRLGGKSTWQAGAVLRWFEARAERAARQAQRAAEQRARTA